MFKISSILTHCVRSRGRSVFISAVNSSHYDVLGVKQDATTEQIKASFIEKSKNFHPDSGSYTEKDGHMKFVELNEAYSVLMKENSRKIYDVSLNGGGSIYDGGDSPKSQGMSSELYFMVGAILAIAATFVMLEVASIEDEKDLEELEKQRTMWLKARQGKKSD
nr:dnaJ homolog subfamily C member 4-like [Ciona intestinalis]|eukprot:XP_018671465.1 dnaJ homolog subfamily C member 4-like [Ciona intestinalis]